VLALSIFGTERPGYFVEFGGLDGVENSNSLLLEKHHGWQGLIAEPARVFHSQLQQNRSCSVDHRAVTDTTGKVLEFKETDVELGLSGLTDYFHPNDRHTDNRKNSTGKVYTVDTVSLNDLLDQHQCPDHIQYLSIDTEGSELEILRNFDFGRRRIDFITVEHNYVDENRTAIQMLMQKNGYCRILKDHSQWDDWYLHLDILKELQ
jgi:FkbM family methyltransferase